MIHDPYSNSVDQTQRNLDAQQAAADLEWMRGFGKCQFNECRYTDLPNEDQRQGWRAAERAGADADTDAYLAERRIATEEYTAVHELGAW